MQKVRIVLMSGKAGSGKSTSVRKLAYDWATLKAIKDVWYLYVVNVGELEPYQHTGKAPSFAETLAKAVIKQCFPEMQAENEV